MHVSTVPLCLNSDLIASGVGVGLDDDDLAILEVELVDQFVVVSSIQLYVRVGRREEGG